MDIIHAILRVTGIDTQQSYFYDYWSGVATSVPMALGAIGFYSHHNCHRKGCWRIGHIDPKTHHPACKKHHSHGHKLG